MDLTPMWFGVYKASKYLLYPLTWIIAAGLFTLLFAMTGIAMGSLIGAFVYSVALHPRRITWWRMDNP